MRTKDNFRCNCCMNCKHSYYLPLNIGYASLESLWNKCPDNPTVFYCNVEKECPLKTQEEFVAYDNDANWDSESDVAKWLNFDDEDDPTSSERYVGLGSGVCDKYEPIEPEKKKETFKIKINWN